MKKYGYILVSSIVLASIIVLTAFHYRQKPYRTDTDAYIPIRSLSPSEAAALLLAEDSRAAGKNPRTIVQTVDEEHVTILTRDYVIEIPKPDKTALAPDNAIQVGGQKYLFDANSWENYVCRYKMPRKPLEQIVGRQLSPTPPADVLRSGIREDRISFSNSRIWIYIVAEILLVSVMLLLAYFVVTKTNFLLWLPCFAVFIISLSFIVKYFSPAFMDGDFFHQRIVIEGILLIVLFICAMSYPVGFYLTVLSLCIFLVYRMGKIFAKKQILILAKYTRIVLVIVVIIATSGSIIEYLQFLKISGNAGHMINNVQKALSTTKTRDLVMTLESHGIDMHQNMLEKEILPADTMNYINGILSSRSNGDPDLRVLIPIEKQYFFLWKNDHFSYGDTRLLKGRYSEIIDREYIEPAVASRCYYKTNFARYLFNVTQWRSTKYIEVAVTLDDKGSLSSAVIASVHRWQ
jgi:hypothetical protein